MTYKVTIFKSERIKQGGIAEFKTFDDLAKEFEKCEKGAKLGSGFSRGELSPAVREDSNATNSNLLIIDGDEGKNGRNAPAPKNVHEALVELNINHYIYTSHSHSAERNKYRVVIDSSSYKPKDLNINNIEILELLKSKSIHIKYVKEMKAWSQIWFEPRSDDPSIFEFYSHTTGKQWRAIDVKENEATQEKTNEEAEEVGDSSTLEELYEQVRKGTEYHTSLRTISYQLVKDGMSKAHTRNILKTLMNASEGAGTERWQSRFDDIDRLVNKIADDEQQSEFDIVVEDNSDVVNTFDPPPRPHGLLGKFIQQTKEFMLYEDETIAFVSTMFIMSSICGRKFNVDIHNADGMAKPTALNMYFTLAAETGVGKSEIEDAVENCYTQFSGNTGAVQEFFYKGRLSGPRALYRVYKDKRSCGIIANEAGIEGQSKLGDSQGLKGAWLNLYGQGAWKKWTGASELSDSDNSIKSVRAVAISRISESTPVELSAFYRQGSSVENGLIPRENIFVIKHLNENPNQNIRLNYSKDIVSRMETLIGKCHADISEETLFKPFIITVDDKNLLAEIIATQKHYRKLQNKGNTIHERAMAGRMFVKMLRYAGLITVFNKDSDNPRALLIDKQDWGWAKRTVEDEYRKIADVVALTSGNDVIDGLVDYVSLKFGQMLSGTIKNNDGKIDVKMRKAGLAPISKLKKVCKANSGFKEIESDPKYSTFYKSGFDKVVDYMVKIGYVEILDKNPLGRGKAIKALDGMVIHLKESKRDV